MARLLGKVVSYAHKGDCRSGHLRYLTHIRGISTAFGPFVQAIAICLILCGGAS